MYANACVDRPMGSVYVKFLHSLYLQIQTLRTDYEQTLLRFIDGIICDRLSSP